MGCCAVERFPHDAVGERRRQTARLRSALREFYPAALRAFPDLTTKTALTVLSAAPTPAQALGLTHGDLYALARGCGRQGITMREVTRLHQVLHQPQLRQPIPVEQAMGTVVLQLVLGLRILNLTIVRLEAELAEQLDRHADTPILRSLPGVGVVLAGRMLSEFGDDPIRFADGQPSGLRRHGTDHQGVREGPGGVDASGS